MDDTAPPPLTSEERSTLQDAYGVCWSTDDDFEEDEKDQPHRIAMINYHKVLAKAIGSHWYFPDDGMFCKEAFPTETEGYAFMRNFRGN